LPVLSTRATSDDMAPDRSPPVGAAAQRHRVRRAWLASPTRMHAVVLLTALGAACGNDGGDLPRDSGSGDPSLDAGQDGAAGSSDAGGPGGVDGGIPDDGSPTDGGMDGSPGLDASAEVDGGQLDAATAMEAGAEPDAGHHFDAGPIQDGGTESDGGSATGSVPSQPAEVIRVGTSGLLLRGTVLTPTAPLPSGEVLIVGNTITCVAADCSAAPGATTATVIDTHGIISPGLIDAHNHLAYDFLDEWMPTRLYGDRYEWAGEASYEAWVAPYADDRSLSAVFCPAAKWGELRAIAHGTTTMQGQSFQQSCVNGLIRNAEHYDGLGWEQLTTNIGSVRDINDTSATNLIARFTAAMNPVTRYAVHMGEGIDTPATLEFDSFAGRDARSNRHMGTSLLSGAGYSGVAVLIHSLPLDAEQLMEAADADAKLVWSPSSNLALYGQTADIALWLSLGLTIGIGPDWTPSGEDDLLAELRFARAYGQEHGVTALTARRLWEMATLDGAEVVGLAPIIGHLAVGSRADVLVIGREGLDPYDALIDANVRDVRLVLVDGTAYYGDLAIKGSTAVNASCDDFDACGTAKFICAKGLPATGPSTTTSRTTETVSDVETQLVDRLATYGRSDLLPLAHECR
jgi:cytosine/adenosine deaminase-related metal-dependent hydrolase